MDSLTVETELFEHRDVKPHFINPCCFGEDFAAWLWMALSFCGDGPTEEPAQWVVSVAYDPGLNLFRRLFHRPDPGGLTQMREAVWGALRTADGIRVLDDGTQ